MRLFSSNENTSPTEPIPVSTNGLDSAKVIEEDSLLVQIDEFRRKAEALQSLINERQDKFLHLEETVREKESKNYLLQSELSKKQEALSGVLEDMKAQFDILADRVDASVVNAVSEAKEPVMEKIHTENVRLYRNLYDFIKEDYDTEELEAIIKSHSGKGKGIVIFSLILTIINTALLAVILLIQVGII